MQQLSCALHTVSIGLSVILLLLLLLLLLQIYRHHGWRLGQW
jgi:hypothetical protein